MQETSVHFLENWLLQLAVLGIGFFYMINSVLLSSQPIFWHLKITILRIEVGQDFNALLIHRGKVETENYWESLVCLQGCSP